MWTKTIPPISGQYWTATRDGLAAGLQTVAYDDSGRLIFAGGSSTWAAWWWSIPVEEPEPPPADAWDRTPAVINPVSKIAANRKAHPFAKP